MPERRTARLIFVFFVLSTLFLFSLALANLQFRTALEPSFDDSVQFSILLFAQAVILLLPGLVAGLALAPFRPKVAEWVGLSALGLVPAWYYIDFSLHRIFGLRLVAPKSWELVWPVLERAGDFTLQSRGQTVLLPIGCFLITEIACYVAARESVRLPGSIFRPAVWCFAIVILAAFFWSAVRIVTAPAVKSRFLPVTDPHPIHITGIMDKSRFHTRPLSELERRSVARLVAAAPAYDSVESRYRALKVVDLPQKRPDVVVIVAESLRYDAIGPDTTPHLSQLADQAVVAGAHYGAGNATQLGYFALLYGLNALWAERAGERNVPPALTSLMKQIGYRSILVGSWSVEGWHGMDRFLNSDTFDRVEIMPLGKTYLEGDKQVVRRARSLLDQTGGGDPSSRVPLFLVVQINGTHYEYHSDLEDQIFQPVTAHHPPWTEQDRPGVANRYRNSVRSMDRTIAPLLDRNCIVVFAGDHGESFGEDGFFLHCSALSPIQVRTPLIVFAPGVQPERLDRPTAHVDLLPTLMDLLGARVNDPDCLHGHSILESQADGVFTPIVLGETRREAWLAIDRGAGSPGNPYRFSGEPLRATFRLEGAVDPARWELNNVALDDFDSAFDRLMNQLCGGSAPEMPDDAYATMVRLLEHLDVQVRRLAVARLGEMGQKSNDAVDRLRPLLDDPDPSIRSAAAEAIRKLLLR